MVRQFRSFFALLAIFALLPAFIAFARAQQSSPAGAYSKTLTDEKFPPKMPPEIRAALAGTWGLTLNAEGGFSVSKDGKVMVEGRYSVSEARITFTDEKGELSCAAVAGQETATYKWVLDEKGLTLKAIQEKCPGRQVVLTTGVWIKGS